jgi:hypothetical protein
MRVLEAIIPVLPILVTQFRQDGRVATFVLDHLDGFRTSFGKWRREPFQLISYISCKVSFFLNTAGYRHFMSMLSTSYRKQKFRGFTPIISSFSCFWASTGLEKLLFISYDTARLGLFEFFYHFLLREFIRRGRDLVKRLIAVLADNFIDGHSRKLLLRQPVAFHFMFWILFHPPWGLVSQLSDLI